MVPSIARAVTDSIKRLTAIIPWEIAGYYWALLAGASISLALLAYPPLTPIVVVTLIGLYLMLPDAAQPVEIRVEFVD